MKMFNPLGVGVLEESPHIETERSDDELFFGQITE
jgi:hypothetical protein